jgi:hypothetical protein
MSKEITLQCTVITRNCNISEVINEFVKEKGNFQYII